MTDKQAVLDNFTEKHADPLHHEAQLALEKILDENYAGIIDGITAVYSELFDRIKAAQEDGKGPIAYINFYLLRTGCMLGNSGCLVCAYDKEWYSDPVPVEAEYDASFLFKPFYEYSEKLYRARKMYVGRITRSDIEKMLIDRWSMYMSYMALMLKNSISGIINLPNYSFQKAEQFSISGGEYMDYTDTLWVEDTTEKDPVSVKTLLLQ